MKVHIVYFNDHETAEYGVSKVFQDHTKAQMHAAQVIKDVMKSSFSHYLRPDWAGEHQEWHRKVMDLLARDRVDDALILFNDINHNEKFQLGIESYEVQP